MQSKENDKLTILDRFALGFLNACVALPTGIVLLLALSGFPGVIFPWLPATSIIWFTLIMTALGMVTNNNILINFYGKIWHMLARWFTYGR